MNEALGNVGTTVTYTAPIAASPADGAASIAELVADMDAGQVEVLVILGGNPVFTAPADLEFARGAREGHGCGSTSGLYHDETAELCHWHVPEAHYLESWGDVRAVRRHGLADPAARSRRSTTGARRSSSSRRMNGAPASRDGTRQGLLDARVRRSDEGGVDAPAAGRRRVRERRNVLASRAARRVHREHARCSFDTRRDASARRGGQPIASRASGRAAADGHGSAAATRGAARVRRRPQPPAWRSSSGRIRTCSTAVREQRLAAGTAEAAVEGHLGQRGVHQPADGRALRHSDRARRQREQRRHRDHLSGPRA